MIFVVDDDDAVLAFVTHALKGAGIAVEGFATPTALLDRLQRVTPVLVISDVMMPGMTGFELRAAVAEQYPNRQLPFIFLSSMGDDASIIKGLELGANDYLTKPIAPELLIAKVRSHLRLLERERGPVFNGDLAKFPAVKILQFCELHGFTGEVTVTAPGLVNSVLSFEGGNIVSDATGKTDEVLEKLLEQRDGSFVLRPRAPDFSALASARAAPMTTKGAAPAHDELPMGRLSGIRVDERLFQIQTELVAKPTALIVTVVIYEGRTLQKRSTPPAPGSDRAALETQIKSQHTAVEVEVQAKVQTLLQKPGSAHPTPKATFDDLLERGLTCYLAKAYAQALELWEQAHGLFPDNKTLQVNLTIVRKKLGV